MDEFLSSGAILSYQGKTYPVVNLSVRESECKPLAWTAVIPDPKAEYVNIQTTPLDHETEESELAQIEIITTIGSRTISDLFLLEKNINITPEDGLEITISGTDFSQVLLQKNQTKESIVTTSQNIKFAKDIIESIAEEYGMTADVPDILIFPVIQFDFQQDQPINRIQTLLNEVGAKWMCEGRNIKIWKPDLTPQGTDFFYESAQNIFSFDLSQQSIEHFDKVTACRVTKNGYVAWQGEGTDSLQDTDLSGEFYYPRIDTTGTIGLYITERQFYHPETLWLEPNQPAVKATKFRFAVLPIPGASDYYWKVKVTGTPSLYLGSGIDLNAASTVSTGDGKRPAENIESNLTATNILAQIKASAFLAEQGRTKNILNFSSIINPYLNISEPIEIDEKVSGINGIYYPQAINTVITGVEGIQNIEVVLYEQ